MRVTDRRQVTSFESRQYSAPALSHWRLPGSDWARWADRAQSFCQLWYPSGLAETFSDFTAVWSAYLFPPSFLPLLLLKLSDLHHRLKTLSAFSCSQCPLSFIPIPISYTSDFILAFASWLEMTEHFIFALWIYSFLIPLQHILITCITPNI